MSPSIRTIPGDETEWINMFILAIYGLIVGLLLLTSSMNGVTNCSLGA